MEIFRSKKYYALKEIQACICGQSNDKTRIRPVAHKSNEVIFVIANLAIIVAPFYLNNIRQPNFWWLEDMPLYLWGLGLSALATISIISITILRVRREHTLSCAFRYALLKVF